MLCLQDPNSLTCNSFRSLDTETGEVGRHYFDSFFRKRIFMNTFAKLKNYSL